MSADPLAGGSPRLCWLPATAPRSEDATPAPWSGGSSLLGVLADDDVSLTFHAGRREDELTE